jgi:hypothetical protein
MLSEKLGFESPRCPFGPLLFSSSGQSGECRGHQAIVLVVVSLVCRVIMFPHVDNGVMPRGFVLQELTSCFRWSGEGNVVCGALVVGSKGQEQSSFCSISNKARRDLGISPLLLVVVEVDKRNPKPVAEPPFGCVVN